MPLTVGLRTTAGPSAGFDWNDSATAAFLAADQELAYATLPVLPTQDTPRRIMTNAPSNAVGAVFEQQVEAVWVTLASFSRKLKPGETRYSTFGGELLPAYLTVKHFRYFIEGPIFHIMTDHKPLTYGFCGSHSCCLARETRPLSLVSEFTRDLRCIRGDDDEAADALSRVDAVFSSRSVSADTLTAAQGGEKELQEL